jgi:hypothetical protein
MEIVEFKVTTELRDNISILLEQMEELNQARKSDESIAPARSFRFDDCDVWDDFV